MKPDVPFVEFPKISRYSREVVVTGCSVVPVLWRGSFEALDVNLVLQKLIDGGSVAAPGFMKPEGIVIFHTAAQWLLKKTIEKDDVPKGARS